jgi:heptosyltransferase-2
MSAPVSSPGSAPRRILVRGVNWLGDAVMSTPALLRLRQAHPDAHITLLTPAKLQDLWAQHPALNAVLPFTPEETVFAVARRLKAEAFDTALILPNSTRSALESWLARIPHRVGAAHVSRNLLLTVRVPRRREEVRMHKPSRGEILRRLSGTEVTRPIPSGAHHLLHYLHLAASLKADPAPLPPLIAVTPQEVEAVRKRFQAPPRSGSALLLGLNPGAEYGPAKRWPEDRFVDTAIALQRQLGCHWWIFGGPADVPLASALAKRIMAGGGGAAESVRCLAGQTSLRELCAALRACDVLLTNDSGPMHLAAALGTPVVVPFGSTSPELTAPGLPASVLANPRAGLPPESASAESAHQILRLPVACSPCFLRVCPIDFRCMNGITVEMMIAAVQRALANTLRTGLRP